MTINPTQFAAQPASTMNFVDQDSLVVGRGAAVGKSAYPRTRAPSG